MATIPHLRVLFFDVFGTCVAQRPPIADELWTAAKEALESEHSSISEESYDKWFEFGGEWNQAINKVETNAKQGKVDWRAIDEYRLEALYNLLARRGLIIASGNASDIQVEEGSLWDKPQLQHLARIWHRLPPWPDTCQGLDLLNQKFSTVALSNTYQELMEGLVARSSIPFTQVYTAELFQSYKPNPKVYFGAAEKMGVKPEECALVAAHLGDLKGAKACGFYAIYVERPLEEKAPELRGEGIPDMTIGEDEEGFVALAGRLRVV